MTSKHVVIRGVVQGVWYRAWMKEQALQLGVTGWVRNRRDGTVEALISGRPEAVAELIARCHAGPPAARVERVEVKEREEAPPASFEQRPTV